MALPPLSLKFGNFWTVLTEEMLLPVEAREIFRTVLSQIYPFESLRNPEEAQIKLDLFWVGVSVELELPLDAQDIFRKALERSGYHEIVDRPPTVAEKQELLEQQARELRDKELQERYTQSTLTDLCLIGKDGQLWYSKYQLARKSSVMNLMIRDDPNVREIPMPDYEIRYIKLTLLFLDADDPSEIPQYTPDEAFLVYQLAHKWNLFKLEQLTSSIMGSKPTWNMLETLRTCQNSNYKTAVRNFMIQGQVKPGVETDIISEYRQLYDLVATLKKYDPVESLVDITMRQKVLDQLFVAISK